MTRPTRKAADPPPRARRPARPALRLSLQFADARHRGALVRTDVARWIRAALAVPAEITVRIVDGDEGLALNRDFRGQDHATNVLTFPYDDAPVLGADLVLCAPVVETEAAAQGIALTHFTSADVVRHPLVARIVEAYDAADAKGR